jgi:hypothetical protein
MSGSLFAGTSQKQAIDDLPIEDENPSFEDEKLSF